MSQKHIDEHEGEIVRGKCFRRVRLLNRHYDADTTKVAASDLEAVDSFHLVHMSVLTPRAHSPSPTIRVSSQRSNPGPFLEPRVGWSQSRNGLRWSSVRSHAVKARGSSTSPVAG